MDVIAVDIETTMTGSRASPHLDHIVLITMNDGERIWSSTEVSEFEDILGDPNILKLFHNGSFDIQFLTHNSFDLRIENVWDTMLAERVLTAGTGEACDLAAVVGRRCGITLNKSIRRTFARQVGELSQVQIEYAENDVRYLIDVYEQQKREIGLREMDHIMWLENSLVPIVADMELAGIGFDKSAWDDILKEEVEILPRLRARVQAELAGSYTLDLFGGGFTGNINLNSPLQLLQALHRIGVDIDSTGEEALKHCLHPVAKVILEYRKHANRLKWDYPQYINPITGRIHPDYNQLGARTGRFSCSDPNMQQVDKSIKFRRMFVAKKGCKFITVDYAQQEMRVMAELSQDKNLLRICSSSDPHLENAWLMYEDSTITKSDPRRDAAKTSGFVLIYGAGVRAFAASTGLPEKKAKVIHKRLHELYPGVDVWGNASWKHLIEYGYVVTLGGRRRYFPNARFDPGKYITVAKNSPIQGSSADMMKLAMLYVSEALDPHHAWLILCVHDELVVEAHEGVVDEVVRIVEREMVRAGEYYVKSVPTIAEAVIADTWTK